MTTDFDAMSIPPGRGRHRPTLRSLRPRPRRRRYRQTSTCPFGRQLPICSQTTLHAGAREPPFTLLETQRQTAVLAAVERLGRPVIADLWQQLPDLAPSTVKKVLDALEKNRLVDHAGDDSQAFVNGVHWWSTALSPTEYDGDLSPIVEAVEGAKLGLRHSTDPHDRSVTVFLPLVELESHLRGLPSEPMDRLRSCIEGIETAGRALRLTVSTHITNDPEPLLAVQVRPATATP